MKAAYLQHILQPDKRRRCEGIMLQRSTCRYWACQSSNRFTYCFNHLVARHPRPSSTSTGPPRLSAPGTTQSAMPSNLRYRVPSRAIPAYAYAPSSTLATSIHHRCSRKRPHRSTGVCRAATVAEVQPSGVATPPTRATAVQQQADTHRAPRPSTCCYQTEFILILELFRVVMIAFCDNLV
ncbi:hypothetical protein TNCT_655461 [Trichonephila clavata]|uniref:Uncharacterized protein n=1 Tax=Trichonephila clavata TaxID=2740835 RepID=A0A8X6FFK1_TRICU|nr:hypothetical protein TNCT_655461 [Trichonephila clavata]